MQRTATHCNTLSLHSDFLFAGVLDMWHAWTYLNTPQHALQHTCNTRCNTLSTCWFPVLDFPFHCITAQPLAHVPGGPLQFAQRIRHVVEAVSQDLPTISKENTGGCIGLSKERWDSWRVWYYKVFIAILKSKPCRELWKISRSQFSIPFILIHLDWSGQIDGHSQSVVKERLTNYYE